MEKQGLNNQEQNTWIYLVGYLQDHGYMPLTREIADYFTTRDDRVSDQLIQYRLKSLEKKGWIKLVPLKKRGIILL